MSLSSEFEEFFRKESSGILRIKGLREELALLPLRQRLNLRDQEGPEGAVLRCLIEDNASSIRLIENELNDGSAVLEVGGGVGLVNVWMQTIGVDVTSIEPAQPGHGAYYRIGQELLRHFNLDGHRWQRYCAHEVNELDREFDLIFSYNVLEHISNLEESIHALSTCLRSGGIMRHSCPNYSIPYEPHFCIPLLPIWPQLTPAIGRIRSDTPLWQSLNFITANRLKRIMKDNGLSVSFDSEHLLNTFKRFETESSFRKKHPTLMRVYHLLRTSGTLNLLKHFPPNLATPVQLSGIKV